MRIDRLPFGSSSPDSNQTRSSQTGKGNRRNKILSFAILATLSLATGSASTLTAEQVAALVGSATSGTDVGFLDLRSTTNLDPGRDGNEPYLFDLDWLTCWTTPRHDVRSVLRRQLHGKHHDVEYLRDLWRNHCDRRRLRHDLLSDIEFFPPGLLRHPGRQRSLLHLRQSRRNH
jgi:hypothetical protein